MNTASEDRDVLDERSGPRRLAARTWRKSRAYLLAVLASVIGAITFQGLRTQDLERQLAREQNRVSGLAELLRKLEGQTLKRADLDELRDELGKGLVDTGIRVRELESGSTAVGRIIARSSASVAFVQGSFGFEDPATKRPLRFVVDEKGSPVRTPDGRPMVTLEGVGAPVQFKFAGTAFVADHDGVLLTNRHVAIPWEDEASLPAIRALGLKPVMRHLHGYLPAVSEPFDVKFLGASDTHDVAVLQGEGVARSTAALPLSPDPPTPGDTAVLMGYPTGIRALLARAGAGFVKELSQRSGLDDDAIAQELALAGLVKPLANRGIVGQVSGDAIVYDAQTAAGGSGGPLLNLKGEVVAINRAMLADFGGSNIGVPARHAFDLLQRFKAAAAEPSASAAR